MSKIEMGACDPGEAERLLSDHELGLVSGGIQDSEDMPAPRWVSPLVIRGFNPQPDPPGMPFGY
jgi:hypothetical protein